MLIAARNGFAVGKSLPYDAEVEYLESTGTQYIDTGCDMAVDGAIECGYRMSSLSYVMQFGQSGIRLQQGGTIYNRFSFGFLDDLKRSIWLADRYNELNRNEDNNWNTVRMDAVTGKCGYNGATATYSHNWNPQAVGLSSFYLFGTRNTVGVIERIGHVQISFMRMWKNGILIRDLTPVRFTNEQGQSEGAMYDRVSGELFRNAGTGAFTIGPDKS